MFFMALIGLIFVNNKGANAQDPALKTPGMKLLPTYVQAHKSGKPIPAELVLEIQRTGKFSNVPLGDLSKATIYRIKTVASTFEEVTGTPLDLENYLGQEEESWHEKINNPDNGFLALNATSPGRKIWTYGWLPSTFTAPDGTEFQPGWYYFDRHLYKVGEKKYTQNNEGTIDLNCGKIFPDIQGMQGVFIAWYADGCANPCLPDVLPFKQPLAEKRGRGRREGLLDPFTGSSWVVMAGCCNIPPAPQYFQYCGGIGFGFGFNYCPLYVPMFGNSCGGGFVNYPSGGGNVTNIFEGDNITTINEGDNIIIINNPVVEDDGPVLPPNGDDDGGPILGDNGDGGPVLGDNGLTGNGSGMALAELSFSDLGIDNSWEDSRNALLLNREAKIGDSVPSTQGGSVQTRPVSTIPTIQEAQASRWNGNTGGQPSVRPTSVPSTQGGSVQTRPVSTIPTIQEAQASRWNGNTGGQPSVRPTSVPSTQGGSVQGRPISVPTIQEAQASRGNGIEPNLNTVQASKPVLPPPSSPVGVSRGIGSGGGRRR